MTKSQYTIYSPNSSINSAIKELLPYFDEVSQKKMQKAILSAKKSIDKYQDNNTDAIARHIFREFIPVSILNQKGFAFEYERSILGKKPDWVDLHEKILIESYTFERGGGSNFIDRITSSITSKCEKYKSIISTYSLLFIVSIYIDFLVPVMDLNEIREDPGLFRPIFDSNDSLSAILFFTETMVMFGKQQYGYICLYSGSSIKTLPNWPFETIKCN